jgi:hypothetical protein
MKSYYETKAAIRYYGRIPGSVEQPHPERSPIDYVPVRFTLSNRRADGWKEAVHIAVANLRTLGIATGNSTFAPVPVRAETPALFRFLKTYGPLTHSALLHETAGTEESYSEDPVAFGKMQFALRRAWSGDATALQLITGEAGERAYVLWATFLHGDGNKWEGVAAKEYAMPTPYAVFCSGSKGQLFCSHECAVLINVRRFRKRQKVEAWRGK